MAKLHRQIDTVRKVREFEALKKRKNFMLAKALKLSLLLFCVLVAINSAQDKRIESKTLRANTRIERVSNEDSALGDENELDENKRSEESRENQKDSVNLVKENEGGFENSILEKKQSLLVDSQGSQNVIAFRSGVDFRKLVDSEDKVQFTPKVGRREILRILSFSSLERVGVQVTNQIPLTLEDAIKLALQNNNDIDSSRIDVRIAELNLKIARSAYDPIISSENYFESRDVPSASTIGGAGASGKFTQTDLNASFSASGFLRFGGGSYQIDFSSARTTTTNQNALLNPQFPSSFSFTYVQPLMRGFRFDFRRRNIEIAKKNLSLTDAQFRQKVIDIITQVEQAYWDLVFALKNLQVQIEGVQQAKQQLESNKRLVEKGILAPVEIVASEAQISTLEQNVYSAQETVTRVENMLKSLILKDRNSNLWFASLVPVSPVDVEVPQISLATAINEALKNRLELRLRQTQSEIQEVEERYYRDLTKPQIDLVGTYTALGIAGTAKEITRTANIVNPDLLARVNQLSALQQLPPLNIPTTVTNIIRPPDVLVGNYFSSLTDLFTARYPTYRIGVKISLPLRNELAEAELGKVLAEKSKLENQKLQIEQAIEAEVRNALQAISTAQARLQAAQSSRSAAETLYESEQRQFRAGVSTFYMVLQRQKEVLEAKGRELQARTDLNKAIANLQRTIGSTLSAKQIEIKEAEIK
jgi:outer membrane protein TolC